MGASAGRPHFSPLIIAGGAALLTGADMSLGACAGRPQFSPLIIAGGAAVAAVLGGLLLDDGVKLGEEAVEGGGSSIPGVPNLAAAPLDDNTRLLLQVAIALLGVVGVSIGESPLAFNTLTQAAVDSLHC